MNQQHTDQQIRDAQGALNVAIGKAVDMRIAYLRADYREAADLMDAMTPYLTHASRVLGTTLADVIDAYEDAIVERRRLCPAVEALFTA